MTSKFFTMGTSAENPSFWICFIFGKCPEGIEWRSLVLQSGGSIELGSSKEFHAYPTFRLCKKYLFSPWTISKYLSSFQLTEEKLQWLKSIYTDTDQKFQVSAILTNITFLLNIVIDVISRSSIKRKRVSILFSASSLCINVFFFLRLLSPYATGLYL